MAVIETVYRVRCSGACRRYLTPDGPQKGDWPDLSEYADRIAAMAAAKKAGWSDCAKHAGHLLWPGDNPACLTMCPDCRRTKAGEG